MSFLNIGCRPFIVPGTFRSEHGKGGFGEITIVFAAMAVSHWIEHQTGWTITRFVRTARRYRTIQIRAGNQTLTAADPLPADLRDALETIAGGDAH